MTSETAPLPAAAPRRDEAIPSRRERSVPHAGWMVVAGKEFADHLWSIRFVVLIVLMGLVALVPMYFAADLIRNNASSASSQSSLFLFLFTLSPTVGDTGVQIPGAWSLVAIVAPLVGLAFSFDAVNGERASGTLPRLLSQPIHRDDVINGKFAAGLAAIGLVLTLIVGIIAAFGIIRLGIVPDAESLLRMVLWLAFTFLYVGVWLAFGLMLSVLIRGAATSALVAFGIWAAFVFLGGLITSIVGGIIAPAVGTPDQQAGAYSLQQTITRLNPDTLYHEGSLVLLNPQVAAVSKPATIGGYQQIAEQVPLLNGRGIDQSLLLIWPHVVILVAAMCLCFAVAYIRFMRQEVRA